MTVYYPEGTPTLGNIKVAALTAVADTTLASVSLGTEINATTSVDMSCFLYPAGWNPSATINKGSRPARLCSVFTQETFNRTTYTLASLQYVYDPQGDNTVADNEAYAALTEGTEVFLVERRGLDSRATDWAAGQKIRTHHVRLGPQIPQGDPTDENGEFYILQDIVYVADGPVDGTVAA